MKVTLALSITGWALERSMQVKDIAFLKSNGENANILNKISWLKDFLSDKPPEDEMEIGTKIKKMV